MYETSTVFQILKQGLFESGAPFQHIPGVGKTAKSGANLPPLVDFLLSYTLKIEKPGVGKRQSGTAKGGQLPTPAPQKNRPWLEFYRSGAAEYEFTLLILLRNSSNEK